MAPLNIDSIVASANSADTSSAGGGTAAAAADAKRGGNCESPFSAQLVQAVQQQPSRDPGAVSGSGRGKANKVDGSTRDDKDSRRDNSADAQGAGSQASASAAPADNSTPPPGSDSATATAAGALVAALDANSADKGATDGKNDTTTSALTGALAKAAAKATGASTAAASSDAASANRDASDKSKSLDPSSSVAAAKAQAEMPIVAGTAHHGKQHTQPHATATASSTTPPLHDGEQQPQAAAIATTNGATGTTPATTPKSANTSADAKTATDNQTNINQGTPVAAIPNSTPAAVTSVDASVAVAAVATTDAPKADTKAHEKKTNDDPAVAKLDSLSSALGLNGASAGQRPMTQGSAASAEASSVDATPTVDRSRFVQRVAGAFRAAEQSGGPVKLRLSPPELGALNLEIQVHQGQIHAHIEVETPQAQSLLLDNISALRDRLEQQDIKVAQFDVGLMGNNNNGGNTPTPDRSWQQSGDGAPRNTFVAPTITVADPATPLTSAVPTPVNFTSGVNVLV